MLAQLAPAAGHRKAHFTVAAVVAREAAVAVEVGTVHILLFLIFACVVLLRRGTHRPLIRTILPSLPKIAHPGAANKGGRSSNSACSKGADASGLNGTCKSYAFAPTRATARGRPSAGINRMVKIAHAGQQ